ncbi:hypothetical protein [Lacinutrix sp. Hel_I_90]|uniref:hypothetical protein n=1 Tax=Lacinutrix sp. Hel_I_90 TaxID=1249999 RepID=UPI000A9C4F82|nr:hypothetical protein [Lacinutrix sp. Hel_I_90]
MEKERGITITNVDKQRLIKELFVGKVSDVLGIEKTTKLLKEATDAINGSDV